MARPVYDDQETNLDELERSFSAPSSATSGSKKLEEQKALEDAYDSPSATESGSSKLARAEEDADNHGFYKSLRDKINQRDSGNDGKKSKFKLLNGIANVKKRIAIAGAVAGASVLAGILAFVVMLPLKLTHIMANIEGKYMAPAQQAATKQAERSFMKYMIKDVLHAVTVGECNNTADPTCRVTPTDCTGVWCRVRGAYRDARLERWLATGNPGLIIRATPDRSRFTVSVREGGEERRVGNEQQYQDLLDGNTSFYDLEGVSATTRTELRQQVRDVLSEHTRWWQIVKRYQIGELLERKYGIKRCMLACEARDKITADLDARKVAFKLRMIQRMLPEKYGLIMTCIVAGDDSCDPNRPEDAEAGDTERLTRMQQRLEGELATYLAQISSESLQEAYQAVLNIRESGGLTRHIMDRAVNKIVGSILGEAAGRASSKIAVGAIPYVGPVISAVLIISALVAGADTWGPMLSQGAYNTLSATAVAFYQGAATVVAEFKSGNLDWDLWGSADQSFATSLSSDPAKAVDLMQNPYLLKLLGLAGSGGTSLALLPSDLLNGKVSAASTADLAYRCDDGQPVPADTLVCPEMNFAEAGNGAATTISEAVGAVPVLPEVAGAINDIAGTPGEWIGGALQYIPGVSAATDYVSEQAATPMAWLQDQVLTIPEMDSGARQIDMVMAGADVAGNSSCQVVIGCKQISDQEAADIRNQYFAEEQAEFRARPLLARIFNTNTPYSLISRVAITMPSTSLALANSGVLGLLTDPLTRIGSIMSNMFSFRTVSADETAQPDPYGIIQFGYPDSEIPNDPEAFWNDNCVEGPLAKYNEDTNTLDVSAWLNSDADQEFDRLRGQMIAKRTNPCLLVHTIIQSTGGLVDSSLLRKGSNY